MRRVYRWVGVELWNTDVDDEVVGCGDEGIDALDGDEVELLREGVAEICVGNWRDVFDIARVVWRCSFE